MTLSLFPSRAAIGVVRGDRVYPTPELLRALQSIVGRVGGVSGMESAEEAEVFSARAFGQVDFQDQVYQTSGARQEAMPEVAQHWHPQQEPTPEVVQPQWIGLEFLPEVFQALGANPRLAAFLANPTSDNLSAALSDETGTGAAVFATSPTLTTPKATSYTVANLPAAGTAGATAQAFVTDANATTFASVVAGGGANFVPVYSDGIDWRIG